MERVVKLGDRNDDVKKLQKALNDKLQPNPKLKVDGIFGKATDKLVKIYQATFNLGIDGVVGRYTWASLLDQQTTTSPATPVVVVSATAPWMKFAKLEIGQKEIKGLKNNPRIIAYHATTTLRAHTDETPWCSSFVNWVLKQDKITGTNSAAAASWLTWGKASTAKYGAIVVINNKKAANSKLTYSGNHVGFLVQEIPTHYIILGGNQSDQVKLSRFPKKSWHLRGYRWPNN